MTLGEFLIRCALVWIALSFLGSIALCWLIRRGTVRFEPIEDRNQFTHEWERRS